jgi:hypothetical protein
VVTFCAIGFPVVFVVIERAYLKQLITGICFFAGSTGAMIIYFAQKSYLVLTGADLNAKFEIVRKDRNRKKKGTTPPEDARLKYAPSKPLDGNTDADRGTLEAQTSGHLTASAKERRRQSRLPHLSTVPEVKFLKEPPKDANELHEIIAYLQGVAVNMAMRVDLNSSDFSSSDSGLRRSISFVPSTTSIAVQQASVSGVSVDVSRSSIPLEHGDSAVQLPPPGVLNALVAGADDADAGNGDVVNNSASAIAGVGETISSTGVWNKQSTISSSAIDLDSSPTERAAQLKPSGPSSKSMRRLLSQENMSTSTRVHPFVNEHEGGDGDDGGGHENGETEKPLNLAF